MKPLIGITGRQRYSEKDDRTIDFAQRPYADAIRKAGGVPFIIPCSTLKEDLSALYSLCAAILIPGGEDVCPQRYGEEPHPTVTYLDPQRDEIEATLISWAFRDKKPCLGLCRGIQIMNVALGGSLFQDIPSMLGKNHYVYDYGSPHSWVKDAHKIKILDNTLLASILNTEELAVNSIHHQAIKQIADGLQVNAEDADGLIEGVESKDHTQFFVGIQCHPESYSATETHAEWAKCFSAFIEAARLTR